MTVMIEVSDLSKTYVLHVQGGTRIPVLTDAALSVQKGQCVALHGPSGAGKSTLLRCLYGNCKPDQGAIHLRRGSTMVDLATAEPRTILEMRRTVIAFATQFLRVIPRVPALDLVAEPARARGVDAAEARERAETLLARLLIPRRLWQLPPATFSGGEQQRVNIARALVAENPILLLDEPTASLDAKARSVVVSLIGEVKSRGTAIVGVFHDDEVRQSVADRLFILEPGKAA